MYNNSIESNKKTAQTTSLDHRYIGICAWFVPGSTYEEKFKFLNEAGLDGIELDFNHNNGVYALADIALQDELLAMQKHYNIDFPAIAINSLCEFGMSKDASWDAVSYALTEGIKTAQNMNIPIVQLPSFFAGDIETEQEFEQTIKAIQFACDLAVDSSITIGSENALPGEKQVELVNAVKRDNFAIYFDCRNSWWMKAIESPPILQAVRPYICEVHLKDGVGQHDEFTLLGEGDAGVLDVINILKQTEYQGRILLENDYNQFAREGLDPVECAKRDIAFIDKHFYA